MISLQSEHLYINHTLVDKIFKDTEYVYAAYNVEQQMLLITPISSQWFIKIYEKPSQFLLKLRNLKGDRTIAIKEILIDNNLPLNDQNLEFELVEKTALLKIGLNSIS